MAFGTPTDGGAAYSAAAGTTVAPAYPVGIAANDVVVLIIGQKPSAANGGTVTTPTGWTLREELTGAGGYGTTLGADTGNTNLRIYTKNVVLGNETGNLTVTIGTNNVSWGLIIHIPGGGASSFSVGSADGSRITAPSNGVPFTTLLTNGTTAPNLQSGDMAIWAMCIPTDVLANGFTLPTISSTGATFGTPVELEEPDSGTGNDIGGYVAYALATAGSSTAAPTVGVRAGGTVTNVRGPIALIRIRDTTRQLTPNLYTNTNSFFSPTVTQTAPSQDLTPARYDNTNVFYSPTVTATGGPQNLIPALYTNTNTFFTHVVTSSNTLAPQLYTNTNVFFTATVTSTRNLDSALYVNTNVFYSPQVSAANLISPQIYTNTNQFFVPIVTQGTPLLPDLYVNQNAFFTQTVTVSNSILPNRYDNTNVFYTPTVINQVGIEPELFVNTNVFYSATALSVYSLLTEPYVDDGYVDPGYIGLNLQNVSQFFSPIVAEPNQTTGNMFLMFFP